MALVVVFAISLPEEETQCEHRRVLQPSVVVVRGVVRPGRKSAPFSYKRRAWTQRRKTQPPSTPIRCFSVQGTKWRCWFVSKHNKRKTKANQQETAISLEAPSPARFVWLQGDFSDATITAVRIGSLFRVLRVLPTNKLMAKGSEKRIPK